jgi:hypothetical protein
MSVAVVKPNMRILNRLRFAAAALLVGCVISKSDAPLSTELSDTGFSLATEKTTYSVADLAPGAAGIRATLTAARDKPYYARLGDAFNGAADQDPLYLAEGSDGVVERQSGDTWVKISSGILVEGVREVVLTPGKTYSLFVTFSPPVQTGTYRLTVFVRASSGGDQTLAIQSATFGVR